MNAEGLRKWGGEGGDPKSKVRRTFVPDGTRTWSFLTTDRWKRWANSGRPQGTAIEAACASVAETAKMPESGGDFVLQDTDDEWVMRLKCPEFRHSGRQASRMRDPKASGTLVVGRRKTRVRGARASRALTGLMGFFVGLTWACARRTRFSPGFHIRGLQPQAGLRPAPHYETPEYPESSFLSRTEVT